MKALARRPVNIVRRARNGALATMLAEVAENDCAVVMAAGRAAEIDSTEAGKALLALPRTELEAQGWASRAELRIAVDAKHNTREVPFYLRMAHERTLLRYRGQDGDSGIERAIIVTPQETAPEDPGIELPPAVEGPDETPG